MVLSQILCVALGYAVALQNPEVDPAAWERANQFVAAYNRTLTPGFDKLSVSLDKAQVSTGPGNEGWTFNVYEPPQLSITVEKNRFGTWEVRNASSMANNWTPDRPSRLPDRPANLPERAIDRGRHLAIVRDMFVSGGYEGQIVIGQTLDRDDMILRFEVQRETKGVAGVQPGYLWIDYETGKLMDFRGWDTTPPTERPDYRISRDDVELIVLEELARRGIAGRAKGLTVRPYTQHLRHVRSNYEGNWSFVDLNATPEELQASLDKRERFVYVSYVFNGLQGAPDERTRGFEKIEISVDPQTGRIIYFDLSRGGIGGPGGPKVTPFPLQGEYRLIRAKRTAAAKGSLQPADAPGAFTGVDFFLRQGERITQATVSKDAKLVRIEGKFYRPDAPLREAIGRLLR